MTEEQRRIMEKAGEMLASLDPAGLRIGFVVAILQLALPEIDQFEFRDLIADLGLVCTNYLENGELDLP